MWAWHVATGDWKRPLMKNMNNEAKIRAWRRTQIKMVAQE
jgi:hypothetical protein